MSLLLTLETTCDETAAAVIDDQLVVRGAVVASQDQLHREFGGVVPEIAARAHLERILPVIDATLGKANVRLTDLQAIAVANTPGLAGSLLVGLSAAKALAVALDIPLIAINHLEAHLYACRIAHGPTAYPCVGLVVSGGHTHLYRCQDPLSYELLGGTIDDAAGEAFDKVAALLGLEYPGGPAIERAARSGNPRAVRFPRTFLNEPERLSFSFSGLKTAVRYQLGKPGTPLSEIELPAAPRIADLAASFQAAVVDVLVGKSIHALQQTGLPTLCVGGGVAANAMLGERMNDAAARHGFQLFIAPKELCTDNAVMSALAWERLRAGKIAELDLDISPGMIRAGAKQ